MKGNTKVKRLVIITVGKTHSGKTTFARALENDLPNSVVIDQDNHAAFINTYYQKLLPNNGPNTLKSAITKGIIDYTIENTNFHLIISNSNRSKKGRLHLLEELFPQKEYIRILVHFQIPDAVLQNRVKQSTRDTNILRNASNFKEVLIRQQAEEVYDPVEGEADHLFIIKDNAEAEKVMKEIIQISTFSNEINEEKRN